MPSLCLLTGLQSGTHPEFAEDSLQSTGLDRYGSRHGRSVGRSLLGMFAYLPMTLGLGSEK